MNGLAQDVGVSKSKVAIAEIVGVMFMSRTYSHMAHLKTGSFAKHAALNGFYDSIVGLSDSLAEGSQGLYGKLNIPFIPIKGNVGAPIASLESHLMTIKKLGQKCDEPYLDNILQEIEALYRSTLYKLKELS